MSAAIHQEAVLAASPERVYQCLTNAGHFSQFSGGQPADISPEAGGLFTCFGGRVVGRTVELVTDRLVVQAWRSSDWPAGLYSIVRFQLLPEGTGTRVVVDQTGYPEEHAEALGNGWQSMYLQPMQAYLSTPVASSVDATAVDSPVTEVLDTSNYYDEVEKVAEALESRNFSFATLCMSKILNSVLPHSQSHDVAQEAGSQSAIAEAHKTIKAIDEKNFNLAALCLRKAAKAFAEGAPPHTLQVLDGVEAALAVQDLGRCLTNEDFSTAATCVRRLGKSFHLA